jgi:hypothetical protein
MEYQYHLFGAGLCGRAIRMRELSASEVEDNACVVVGLVSEQANMMKLNQTEVREGIKLALTAISKKGNLSPEQVAKLRSSDWEQVSLVRLKMPESPYCYEMLFSSAKDHAALARIWRRLHVPKEQEIDAIVEKGCPVATVEEVTSIGSATGTTG